MKNVIITGADGFVGSYTTEFFLNNNIKVLAVDCSEKPKRLKHRDGLKYVTANVFDIDGMHARIPVDAYDTMIHFAWAGSAGPDRVDYNLQMKNALTTVECMKLAKELGCNRFVCAGSIMEKEVIASVDSQGTKPGMAYIYGIGKMMAHALCKSVASQIGIDLIWPMITNAYGIGEFSPRFMNTTIRKIINKEPLQFTAGTQNYDFVYVTDVAKAFYLIAKNGKPFCEYMIGSSHARPLREFIIEMASVLDSNNPPIFGDIPFTGTNLPLTVFDTSNTERDTGFKAEIAFAEGIRLTMEWLKTL